MFNSERSISIFILLIILLTLYLFVFKDGKNRLSINDRCGSNSNCSTTSGSKESTNNKFEQKLVLVNIIQRHGDRSIEDKRSLANISNDQLYFIWPDGLATLTDLGYFRMFKVGLKLQQMYSNDLITCRDYGKQVLALSPLGISRSYDSMKSVLAGLIAIDSINLKLAKSMASGNQDHVTGVCHNHQILIRSDLMPILGELSRLEDPNGITMPRVDVSLESLGIIPGIELLTEFIKTQFGFADNLASVIDLYSNLEPLMGLVLAQNSANISDKYRPWLLQPVKSKNGVQMNLNDVIEFVNLYAQVLITPEEMTQSMVTSIIGSQLMSLNRSFDVDNKLWSRDKHQAYTNKTMILYASHDSYMETLLYVIGLIDINPSSFEERFFDYHQKPEWFKFLNGIVRAQFGMTAILELWTSKVQTKSNSSLPVNYVKLKLYEHDEIKFSTIEFEYVKLGEVCKSQFKSKYPDEVLMNQFYPGEHEADLGWTYTDFECPFDLWLNLTSIFMISDSKLSSKIDNDKWIKLVH